MSLSMVEGSPKEPMDRAFAYDERVIETLTPGSGSLRCERVGARTVVHTARAHSPLRLLLPRNEGHAQWAYVSTLGGGIVNGDTIDLDVEAAARTTVLLGTQAGTKAYRSVRGTSQALRARVGEDALLAIVPDPVTCFAGSRHTQETDVVLHRTASLVLVDTMTSGRAGHGERWAFDRFESRTRITRDGACLVQDAILFDPAHGDLAMRMGAFDVVAMVLAIGSRARVVRDALLDAHRRPAPGDPVVASASALGDDGTLLRLAATHVEPALKQLRKWLDPLEIELGDNPFARKW